MLWYFVQLLSPSKHDIFDPGIPHLYNYSSGIDDGPCFGSGSGKETSTTTPATTTPATILNHQAEDNENAKKASLPLLSGPSHKLCPLDRLETIKKMAYSVPGRFYIALQKQQQMYSTTPYAFKAGRVGTYISQEGQLPFERNSTAAPCSERFRAPDTHKILY